MNARKAVATALMLWAGGVCAAPPQGDLNARVKRLEQLVASRTLAEMVTRMDSLQQEMQALRGKIEEQGHSIATLKRQQRDLYMDLDRRLSQLEKSEAASGTNDTQASAETRAAELSEYQQALNLLHGSHYEQAIRSLRELRQRYPNGRYAQSAQYWIGQAFYVQREFRNAIIEYQLLIDSYPKSGKIPELLLKIGKSYRELGEPERAVEALRSLVAKYPDSSEAGQARKLLKQIKPGQ